MFSPLLAYNLCTCLDHQQTIWTMCAGSVVLRYRDFVSEHNYNVSVIIKHLLLDIHVLAIAFQCNGNNCAHTHTCTCTYGINGIMLIEHSCQQYMYGPTHYTNTPSWYQFKLRWTVLFFIRVTFKKLFAPFIEFIVEHWHQTHETVGVNYIRIKPPGCEQTVRHVPSEGLLP